MSSLRLFWLFLRSPSAAAEACRQKGAFMATMRIYLLFTVLYLLFFWLKPAGFPDAPAAAPASPGLLFWLKVMLWQPPLEAAWIVFLIGMIRWFRGTFFPLRLVAAVLWTAAPLALAAFGAAGGLLWLIPFYFLLRGASRSEWLPLAGFMLGLNAIALVLLPPLIAAVLSRIPSVFTTVQAAGGLWMLAAAALGTRRLCGEKLARAFMSVLFSMFLQIALALSLHRMGLISKDILKALLYV